MSMFCFQCQEAAKGIACEVRGTCGKNATTAALQDVLLHLARSLSQAASVLDQHRIATPTVSTWLRDALFTTITNANFDDEAIEGKIAAGAALFTALQARGAAAGVTLRSWNRDGAVNRQELLTLAPTVGVRRTAHEDVRSLRELLTYGLKGMAAYLAHAAELGRVDVALDHFLLEALAATLDDSLSGGELTALVLRTGEFGVKAMALLDGANTSRFGHPEITKVSLAAGTRPGILVSGHDLADLEQLLEQSKDAGIDVYTHSEMLPAHYYPAFKKYAHLRGNYGNAWWQQVKEFEAFRGAILFTTNCIVPPPAHATYRDRVFTTGSAGHPDFHHVEKRADGSKDFSALIALAQQCQAPLPLEEGEIIGGFAHDQVSKLAGAVVEAVKSGAVTKFVVMAGCDGRQKGRSYYTDFARDLPSSAIILTAGCAKYRYNKLDLGTIGGIPRVLDAGQCNDSYSLAVTALALKDAFGLADINDLPIEYNLAWYEQKAVIVLLALLHLGVKNIQLGPTLPAFLSPGVAQVLVETFGIHGIAPVSQELAAE